MLPAWPEQSPGPHPVDNPLSLQGILFVLHTGTTWPQLPSQLGFGSARTCWRRLGPPAGRQALNRITPGRAERGRPDRPDERLREHLPRPRVKGARRRARHRSTGPRPAASTPPDQRRQRHPLPRDHHRHQRQRRHPDTPRRPPWPAGLPTRAHMPQRPAQKQGLRQQPQPPGTAQTPDPAGPPPTAASPT
ncbi:transposase [Kitasatospora sp. NPDC059673]|uniref:transposase n=1 Tax=Kitasatospora sp. NPDC059673 TaxID=3346901 RepID=UPI00369003B1